MSLSRFRPFIAKALRVVNAHKLVHFFYYNHVHGFNAAIKDTVPAVQKAFDIAIDCGAATKGDYYEFGVFKGFTFWNAQQKANAENLDKMRFFGFDSFAGLPEIEGLDITANEEFYEGQYNCSKQDVEKNLDARGVDWQRTHLIEGYFDKTLTDKTKEQYKAKKIAIALIDCDLYSSTVDVLNFIDGMLLEGTVLMFDDWNCFNKDDEKGQRKAFAEFKQQHAGFAVKELYPYGPHGQVFQVTSI